MNPARSKGESEKRKMFLENYIKIFHGHWGGYWQLHSYPEAESITFDKNMEYARVDFRLVYEGGFAILKNEYFENNILCLKDDFSEILLEKRKVFLPTKSDFPIEWNSSKENAFEVLKIVSEAMQINPSEIEIEFYSEGAIELNSGTFSIFLENDTESELSAGQYHGKNENGKYEISVNTNTLKNPEALIATIVKFNHKKRI